MRNAALDGPISRLLGRESDAVCCPGSDDTFRISLFALPPAEDTITPALSKAVVHVMNGAKADDFS